MLTEPYHTTHSVHTYGMYCMCICKVNGGSLFLCFSPLQLYFSKVQRLISWSQDLSKSSTVYRQLVQSSAVDVSAKWRKAVDVATNRKSFLQEALTFHVNLFEVR